MVSDFLVFRRKCILLRAGPMASMRHEKESILEAHPGQDVGLSITNKYSSEYAGVKYEMGDIVECYEVRQVPQTTRWTPKGF